MGIKPAFRHIYDTTSVPWDWYRSGSKFSTRFNGVGWQFDTNTSAAVDLAARIRAKIGASNLHGRYCTPNKIYDGVTGAGVWCPSAAEVATYFGANVHDTTLSPYLHNSGTYNDGSRMPYLTLADKYWARFAQANWLDYIFGVAEGTGLRADASDCWVKDKHLDVEPYIFVLCNDSITDEDDIASIDEDAYDSNAEWFANYATYLAAFKDRICTPRDIKLIGNLGLDSATYSLVADCLTPLDGAIFEHFFVRFTGTGRYAWNSGSYRLYEHIEILKHFVSNDKMVILEPDWFMLPFGLTASSGTGYFKIYEMATGRAIGLKHADINGGAYTDYLLSDYDTIAALITAMETDYDSVLNFHVVPETYYADYLAQYDHPETLATKAEASFTTTAVYAQQMEPSRYCWLTLLSLGVLAGMGQNNDIYLGVNPNSSMNWNNEQERYSDLMNFPLGYADVTQADYIQCPGTTETDQYSRNLVDEYENVNGYGILNWEATELVVSATDFNITSFIDPFVTRFNAAYTLAGAAKVTTVTIPPYAGTVLLIGDATAPPPSPPDPEFEQNFGQEFDADYFV